MTMFDLLSDEPIIKTSNDVICEERLKSVLGFAYLNYPIIKHRKKT